MDNAPLRIDRVNDLRSLVAGWRQTGQRIALVPTMGALHKGHLSLVELARSRAQRCIVSIFVNPKQFGAGEDLDAYPRDEASDLAKLANIGADAVFIPTVEEIYPPGYATTVSVSGVSEGLCGGSRPGHFDGVATVVTKLLMQALPDIAVFGEKDYQQLMVIRRMVADLNIPVEIAGAPIVREANGLALSSRNGYLSEEERRIAPLLQSVMQETSARLGKGEPARLVINDATAKLSDGGFRPEYYELREASTLQPLETLGSEPARLLAAAWLGRTRLIDNIAVMR